MLSRCFFYFSVSVGAFVIRRDRSLPFSHIILDFLQSHLTMMYLSKQNSLFVFKQPSNLRFAIPAGCHMDI